MEDVIRKAIKALSERAGGEKDSADAQRFSQAALNLSHTLATLDNLRK